MASFSVQVGADQIVSDVRHDEEEFGEMIALIAHEVSQLAGDDLDALRDYVVQYGKPESLRAFIAMLSAAEAEAR